MRILVADKLAQEGLEFLTQSKAAFDVKVGLKEEELAAAVGEYDALIVRSGAKVTARVLEKPGKLKAIARAGVGVDNIDLEAATSRGILVLNTAEASTLSTAEHAPGAASFPGEKGPAGERQPQIGATGMEEAQRLPGHAARGEDAGDRGARPDRPDRRGAVLAMEMNVVACDPYFTGPTALDGKVKLIGDFDQFLSQIDVISFHVPGGAQTKHLLNRERLMSKCRPNLLVINDSRGEVVDEIALADAIKEKKIAGAAIDVYATEPPAKDHPLFALENVVLTPHLGASTDEAQTAVSVEACKAIVAYLNTGEIRGAVNAGGLKLDLPADEKPFVELARRIGALLAALCDGGYRTITLRASGTRAPKHMNTLLRLATVELLRPHLDTGVNVINVEHLARARGIELVTIHEPSPPAGLVGDIVGVRADGPEGQSHRVLGTVYADGLPRVLRVDGYSMDMIPEGNMVLIVNQDQPGVIGVVGSSFGDAQVNIADMVISREFAADGKATALMVIKTDSEPTASLLERLKSRPNILKVKSLVLPARPK